MSLELLDKLVCEMKNGKSQDEQLLSAEHFKFDGPSRGPTYNPTVR